MNTKDVLEHSDINEKTEDEIDSHEKVDLVKKETDDTLSKKKTQQDRMLGHHQTNKQIQKSEHSYSLNDLVMSSLE